MVFHGHEMRCMEISGVGDVGRINVDEKKR